MRLFWLCGLFAVVLMMQQPTRILPSHCLMAQTLIAQAPGNPEHKEPPPGWNCSRDAREAAKRCACHRPCSENPDGSISQPRDPQCKADCFESHCHCKEASCP